MKANANKKPTDGTIRELRSPRAASILWAVVFSYSCALCPREDPGQTAFSCEHCSIDVHDFHLRCGADDPLGAYRQTVVADGKTATKNIVVNAPLFGWRHQKAGPL